MQGMENLKRGHEIIFFFLFMGFSKMASGFRNSFDFEDIKEPELPTPWLISYLLHFQMDEGEIFNYDYEIFFHVFWFLS